MAKMISLNYFHGSSPLHSMDCRIKLLCLALFSLSVSLASDLLAFLLLSASLTAAVILSKLPVTALLKELRHFSFLLLFIIIANSFSFSDVPLTLSFSLRITVEGTVTGLMFAWRLVLILTICVIMAGTTPLRTLRNTIEWYLQFLPFIPASRVSTMINLTFVLVPIILGQVSEISQAQKARCIEQRRNPLKRVSSLIYPLLSQAFQKTDELVSAMEARCYSDHRTKAVFTATITDWFLLVCSILVFALLCWHTV